MDKNRIEGAAEQGERAMNREALVIKAKRRKSGLNISNRPVRTRMPGGVAGAQSTKTTPYADYWPLP